MASGETDPTEQMLELSYSRASATARNSSTVYGVPASIFNPYFASRSGVRARTETLAARRRIVARRSGQTKLGFESLSVRPVSAESEPDSTALDFFLSFSSRTK